MRLLVFLFSWLAAINALANYENVTSKRCDGVRVELKNEERIMIDYGKQLIVFGETNGDCRSIKVFPFAVFDDPKEIFIADDLGMGKNSCRPGEIYEVEGEGFLHAVIGDDSITFLDLDGCREFVYNF